MTANTESTTLFNEGMTEFTNKNYGKSIELLTSCVKDDSGNKLAYIGRGAVRLKLGQVDDAVSDFEKAMELDPDYSRAFHLRGLAREKSGDNDGAKDDFDRAIAIDPDYGAAYYSRATLLTKMGREDQAVEDMEMVTHLTNRNLEEFSNNNNVWRSQFLKLEAMGVASEQDR